MRIPSQTHPRPLSRALLASCFLAAAASGCGNDEPTAQDYDDVAASVGGLVAGGGGEMASFADSIETAQGQTPAGFSSSGSGQYEGTRGGVTYAYEVTCRDVGGDLMAQCDATTDSASLSVAWSGDYQGQYWQFTVSRTGDWTVRGLQSDTAVFDGQGTFDVTSASQSLDGRRARTFVLAYAATYDDIRWDTATGVVSNGRIAYDVHVERLVQGQAGERGAEFDIDAEVSFDGGTSARLVLDGSRSYRIDLATGVVVGE